MRRRKTPVIPLLSFRKASCLPIAFPFDIENESGIAAERVEVAVFKTYFKTEYMPRQGGDVPAAAVPRNPVGAVARKRNAVFMRKTGDRFAVSQNIHIDTLHIPGFVHRHRCAVGPEVPMGLAAVPDAFPRRDGGNRIRVGG